MTWGGGQRGHDLEVEPVQLQQAESGGGDGRHHVAVGVAAAGQPAPGSLQPVLPAGQPRVVGPDVLVEPQRPARRRPIPATPGTPGCSAHSDLRPQLPPGGDRPPSPMPTPHPARGGPHVRGRVRTTSLSGTTPYETVRPTV